MTTDRHTQKDLCYRQLRRLLIHGQIPEGQRLGENLWATRLGVHRSSLREAMAILAHEGLLDRGSGGGFFAPQLDADALREIIETRITIECGAIRLALSRPSCPATDQLRGICQSMAQMVEQDFDLGFVEADQRFHETLVTLAGNRRLEQVYAHAPLGIQPSKIADRPARVAGFRATIAEHQSLCDMIDAKLADQACTALRQHLLVSLEKLAAWSVN